MNILSELIQSTFALHERFKTAQTVQQALERFIEEYDETLDAIAEGKTKDEVAQEFVDVLVTIIGVFISLQKSTDNRESLITLFMLIKQTHALYQAIRKYGIESTMLEQPMRKVIDKNNAKTLETHSLDMTTGKIKRKT